MKLQFKPLNIFKKESYVINGKEIIKPRSKALLPVIITLAFFIFCCYFIPTKGLTIKFDQFSVLLKKMFTPNKTKDWAGWFSYMFGLKTIIFETLKITFAGTFLGSCLSIPLSVLASRNIMKKSWIYQPIRIIMNFIRTIPTLVLAVVAMLLFGIGAFPGVVAITIFTFGLMTKMMYEIIETVDMGPYEALESTGASKIQAFRAAVVPQVLPVFLGFLAARNVVGPKVSKIGEVILIIIRTFPELLLALILLRVCGVGAFTGCLAIGIHSVGIIGKLYAESIENMENGPIEALDAVGADSLTKIRYGIIPQVMPEFLSTVLYRFDINVRTATVLGVVSAGGLGTPMIFAIAGYKWSDLGAILIAIIIMVVVVDLISSFLRKKLI